MQIGTGKTRDSQHQSHVVSGVFLVARETKAPRDLKMKGGIFDKSMIYPSEVAYLGKKRPKSGLRLEAEQKVIFY